MAQIDARIPLMVQAPQIEPFQNALARGLRTRQMQAETQLQQQKIGDSNALRDIARRGELFGADGMLAPNALQAIAQNAPGAVPQFAQLAAQQQRQSRIDQGTELERNRAFMEWAQAGLVGSETPDAARAYVMQGVQTGVIPQEAAQRIISTIPQDPAQYQQWRQQQTAGMTKWSAPQQSSAGFFRVGPGGQPQFLEDPTTGERIMPITLDATGQARVVAAKEAAKTTAKAQAENAMELPKAEASAQQMLDLLDSIEKHPGKSKAVGAYVGNVSPLVLGPDAVDFQRQLEQLQGKLFLEAYQSLRGGGQITEIEGAKAEAAMANMSRAQSEAQFNKALRDLREVVDAGRERARKGAGASPQATAAPARTVARRGKLNGRPVVQYSDGTIEYAE